MDVVCWVRLCTRNAKSSGYVCHDIEGFSYVMYKKLLTFNLTQEIHSSCDSGSFLPDDGELPAPPFQAL